MQNDLQLLIAELQQEHDLLEIELNNCLQDTDYKGATFYQKALGYTAEKLRILRNLENPNYDRINELTDILRKLKDKYHPTEYARFAKIINDKQIPIYEDKLKQLERKELKYQLDSDEIALCLENLLVHKIEKITIELPTTTITLSISFANKALHIELIGMQVAPLDKHLSNRGLAELKNMQFEFSEASALKIIDNFTERDIPSVLQILSRIAFDVFGLFGDKKAVMHIRKKRNSVIS